jgi:hypothetical protein
MGQYYKTFSAATGITGNSLAHFMLSIPQAE